MSGGATDPLQVVVFRNRFRSFAWVSIRVILGVLLGLFVRAITPGQSSAHHANVPPQKIGSINGFENEQFCISVADSDMSFNTALTRIRGTLINQPGWQRVGEGTSKHGMVFFVGSASCESYSQPGLAAIEIQISVQNSLPPGCGTNNPGCVGFDDDDRYTDPRSGLIEYRHAYPYLNTYWLGSDDQLTYRNLVNHETGHVLGLCDGGPFANLAWPGCTAQSGHFSCLTPTGSMMHKYGCSRQEWPTVIDLATVSGIIPGSAGGGGGGNKGAFGWF
jgi:hypothetical protein